MEAEKRKPAYRAALQAQRVLLRDYELTARSFNERAIKAAKEYSNLIPSRVAHFTLGPALYRAVHNHMMHAGWGLKFKKENELRTLSSDGRSGIRLLGPYGTTVRQGFNLRRSAAAEGGFEGKRLSVSLSVIYGTASGKTVRMPLKIDPKDDYLIDGLHHPIHIIRIIRRTEHGHDKFYAQLLVEV